MARRYCTLTLWRASILLGANMKRCLRSFASDGYEQSLRAIEGFENTLLRVNGQF
jgi:hypothetical protein